MYSLYCQTQVLGLGLGVDFTFAWDNNDNDNNDNDNNKNNPHLNFVKGTGQEDKEQFQCKKWFGKIYIRSRDIGKNTRNFFCFARKAKF